MLRQMIALILFSASTGLAQDRDGNDTAGDWKVTHYETRGLWTSICDEREESEGLAQRCYIRWVDVFSPRPEFGAVFVFITPDGVGERVEFGLEPGTLFAPDGFRIERDGAAIWSTLRAGCLTGVSCAFSGQDAVDLIAAMGAGQAVRLTFRDRHGKPRDLTWDLDRFEAALADFRTASQARGLR